MCVYLVLYRIVYLQFNHSDSIIIGESRVIVSHVTFIQLHSQGILSAITKCYVLRSTVGPNAHSGGKRWEKSEQVILRWLVNVGHSKYTLSNTFHYKINVCKIF